MARFSAMFGAKREIKMDLDLARILTKVFYRHDWVADNLMTPAARRSYFAQTSALPSSLEFKERLERKSAILNDTYRPRKLK